MTSSNASSTDSSSGEDRALAICGWSALALLIAAVLTFGAHSHLGLWQAKDPQAEELALHLQLGRIAADLGLSRQADTRSGELEKNPAKLAALRQEIAQILARYPRSPRAKLYQALERLAAGDFAAARQAAEQSAAIEPRNLTAVLVIGVTYYQEKNFPDAEKAFRRAIEIEPKALSAYDNLGQTLWLEGRQDEALEVYRQRAALEGLPLAPQAPGTTQNRPSQEAPQAPGTSEEP